MPDQPALLRQWTILRSLGARRQGATLRDLAAEAQGSTKTIFRDLILLRRLGFPPVDESGEQRRKLWKFNGHTGLLQLTFTVEEPRHSIWEGIPARMREFLAATFPRLNSRGHIEASSASSSSSESSAFRG